MIVQHGPRGPISKFISDYPKSETLSLSVLGSVQSACRLVSLAKQQPLAGRRVPEEEPLTFQSPSYITGKSPSFSSASPQTTTCSKYWILILSLFLRP